MKTVTQENRIEAARFFDIDRLHAIRHAALRLALMEQHEKAHPDRARILRLVDRFRVADAFGFYSTRPEYWRTS